MIKSKDRTIQNRLFDCAWIIFLITQVVSITAAYALDNSSFKVLCYKGCAIISCGLCLAVIVINLIKKVYPLKTFICYACFGIVCALSWWSNRDFMLLWIFLLFMGAYELSSKRIIAISLLIMGASLIITVGLSLIGLAYNGNVTDEMGRVRYFLGYNWTTNSVTLLFFIALQYIYLRKDKMRFWEYAALELANVFLFIETETKLPFFLLTAVLVFFMVQGMFKNHWKFLKHLNVLYLLVPIAMCVVTIYIYNYLYRGSNLWLWMNQFLNGRLLFGAIGIRDYGITAFGREIIWAGNSVTARIGDYFYVDCSYIKIMLEAGWVFLTAVIAIYTRLIRRAEKNMDYWLVIIAIIILVHSFTEPRLMDMTFNVIPILAFARLGESSLEYKKGFLKEIFGGVQ